MGDVLPVDRMLDPATVGRLRDAGAPFAGRLAALLPELLAAESLLVAPTGVQPCHRDLFADNVRRTQEAGLVVLDWEDSGPAARPRS